MHKVLLTGILAVFTFLLPATGNAQQAITSEIDKRLHLADSLRRKIKYSDAWNQLATIKSLQEKMDTEQLALFHKLTGVTEFGLRKYTSALASFDKSKAELEQLATPKSRIDFVNIFTLKGSVFNSTGEYEKARDILISGLNAAKELPEADQLKAKRYLLNNLAEAYELLGQYDNAVKTTKEALEIIRKLDQEESVGGGVAHNNLGICYRQLGRYELAKEHYTQAAEIFTATLGPTSRYAQAALGNAATSIDDYGDVEKSIPILTKRLNYVQEDPGADQLYIVNTYSTLGYVYKRIGDYKKSRESYERALGKLRSMNNYKKDLEIRILNSLATNEIHQESLAKARIYLDEALEIQEATQTLASADYVRLLDTDATYYQATNQADRFYDAIEKAIRISSKDEKNQLGLILLNKPRYIEALTLKGEYALAQLQIDSTATLIERNKGRIPASDLIRVNANLDGRRASLACASGNVEQAFADGLDEKLIAHTKVLIEATASATGKKNQRYSSYNVGDLLDALVSLHLQAHKKGINPSENHLEKALVVLDLKSSYLTNIWRNEHFSGLPEREKKQAKEIRQRIAAYDLLIFENNEDTPAAQKQNSLYMDSILILRPQLAQYIDKLKSKPLDFEKSFDYTQLDEDQAVLLFHQEGDILHCLFVHHKGLLHNTIPNANNLQHKLKEYALFCKSENEGFRESLTTLNLGAELYETLVAWLPDEVLYGTSRIAIIDGYPVQSFPFAALPTKPTPKEAMGFRDVNFAVEKHAFSYHQSPSSFFDAQRRPSYDGSIKLTALAPSQLSSESLAATGKTNSPSVGLAFANQEVETLVKKHNGTLRSGKEADFNGLLSAFQTSNVVHIASHAASNYDDGEYSYIIITDTTLLSGKRLYARTISEMELPADLVVLAACESGSGKLRSGEGTLSLANVFLNTGTRSVLHTGWRVEDKRSQEVLFKFYDNLAENQPLDQALVHAQRGYLASAGGQYLHPFYWSSFAVSGTMAATENAWSQWLYIGVPLALLLLSFLYWKRK